MLGRDEKRNVRRLQRRLEQLDETSVLEFKVGLERTLAYGTSRVDRG